MKLGQYQKIQALDNTGNTMAYLTDVMTILNYNISRLSYDEFQDIYEQEMEQLQRKPYIFFKYIRIGWKLFKIQKNLSKIKFVDWVRYDTLVSNLSEDELVQSVDELLAILLKEKFLWFLPMKQNVEKKKLYIQKHLDVNKGLALSFFFLRHVQSYIDRMKVSYLHQIMLEQEVTEVKF